MDRRKLAGRRAEADCAEYLRRRGYKILGMNYSCGWESLTSSRKRAALWPS